MELEELRRQLSKHEKESGEVWAGIGSRLAVMESRLDTVTRLLWALLTIAASGFVAYLFGVPLQP